MVHQLQRGDGRLATAAQISFPARIAFDSSNNLYIAEDQGHRVRKVDNNTGIISTVVGDGTMASTGDRELAIAAQIRSPREMVFDSSSNNQHNNASLPNIQTNTGTHSSSPGTGVIGWD